MKEGIRDKSERCRMTGGETLVGEPELEVLADESVEGRFGLGLMHALRPLVDADKDRNGIGVTIFGWDTVVCI